MNRTTFPRLPLLALAAAAGVLLALPALAGRDDGWRDVHGADARAPGQWLSFDNPYGRDVRLDVRLFSPDGALRLRGDDGRLALRLALPSLRPGRSASACVVSSPDAYGRGAHEGHVLVTAYDARTGRRLDRRWQDVRCEPSREAFGDRGREGWRDARRDDRGRDGWDRDGRDRDERYRDGSRFGR